MKMIKHREILELIVAELVVMDPDCSISVLGSLARGEEREGSDIDMYVFLSREPEHFNDLIYKDNRERMRHDTQRGGITIDIGSRLLSSLEAKVPENASIVPYCFVIGKIVRDPSGGLARWAQVIQRWLDQRPWVVELWDRQLDEMRRYKRDPSYPLQYKEQEFYTHLRELVVQRKKETPQQPSAGDSSPRAVRVSEPPKK